MCRLAYGFGSSCSSMTRRNLVVSHRHVLSCAAPYITYNLNSAGHQSERPDLLVQLLENHCEEEVAHQESLRWTRKATTATLRCGGGGSARCRRVDPPSPAKGRWGVIRHRRRCRKIPAYACGDVSQRPAAHATRSPLPTAPGTLVWVPSRNLGGGVAGLLPPPPAV